MDKDIANAYISKSNLVSRRKSQGVMINSSSMKKPLGVAIGKRMNPLPPIEQYQLYSSVNNTASNFASAHQTLPVKKNQRNAAQAEMQSVEKSVRDAMVNDIFANKK